MILVQMVVTTVIGGCKRNQPISRVNSTRGAGDRELATVKKLEVIDQVRAALRSEPRVRPTEQPIHLALSGRDLTMEGEVDHIAGKKLALECAARIAGIEMITDRLRVRAAIPMDDGEIRDSVRGALLQDTDLSQNAILLNRLAVEG